MTKTSKISTGAPLGRRALLGRLGLAAGTAYLAPAMLSLSHARASGGSFSGASANSYSAPSGNSRSASSGSSYSGPRTQGNSRSSFSAPRRRTTRRGLTFEAWLRRMFAR